ncbi:flagellar basal-body rod protein FlgB [Acidovorax sp. 56]|uniref:flagellar basal body rod protein FlgB n=1 Tax=Acidovorax sp. 56 TaxID=2035205 RepID=UPI000C16973A|nr:flagellar basal body rod protein FlgB [Acidovorax sp. 56]PIF27496.1 flagellar basal-body rod protein FlgB [Acidovorax sp. 56]
MLDKMTNQLGFQGNALILRAERQRIIASNIANADTPGYVSRDFDFAKTLREATESDASSVVKNLATGGTGPAVSTATSDPRHFQATTTGSGSASTLSGPSKLGYAVQTQPALDNNSVDLDRERSNFVDNAVRYEATLRFINGNAKTMLSAIQGQ